MKERGWIEPIVDRVVGQVLDTHAAQLRIEIVRRVMEEIAAQPKSEELETVESAPAEVNHDAASESRAADLARAVAEIQAGSSQREILRALLDASARYASRVALFVIKGSHATGWQARGFSNCDAVKDFALDGSTPAIARAIADRVVVKARRFADMDPRFREEFGTPASGEGRIFPLILKDKAAALLYADSGTDAPGLLDDGSLELLVLSTSAWLEVNSLRKQAHKELVQADSHGAQAPPQHAPMHHAPAYNDPFASHAPSYAMAAAATGEASLSAASAAIEPPTQIAVSEAQSAAFEMEPALIEQAPIEPPSTDHVNAETGLLTPPIPSISPEHQDTHRKAQRFARLLVDEIKLYNQAKVAEGRKNKDLYDRLQEEIEKSRATYHKRYGNTVAASANYFQHEIIRSLAEDDLSNMGANFRH